jgi:hypothetical protein
MVNRRPGSSASGDGYAVALFVKLRGLFRPLAQGPSRLRACRASLGDRGGIPILPSLRFVQDG